MLALLGLVVAFAAAGCGGGGSGAASTSSVLDVSKAFSDAGLPFTTEVTSNPYIAGQKVYLPGKLNTGDVPTHVLAMLSGLDLATHAGWIAWVFDTNAEAAAAVKELPLDRWNVGGGSETHAMRANVVVVTTGFTGSRTASLGKALAALKR
jgi:hypothetical protein